MSRHLISRRRFLSLPLAVFLAQVGRRPAQGWAATSPPRKGAYTADVGILYGLLTFRLEGVLTEATDREAGRYHVTIAGEGDGIANQIESSGLLRDGRWVPLEGYSSFSVKGRQSRSELRYDWTRHTVEYHFRGETFFLRRLRVADDVVSVPEGVHVDDLVTLGEVLWRLSVPSPARFETARQLDVQVGGAEANVAAACARLGLKVAWISALPANQWGDRIRRELVGHGVDCAHVRTTEHARVGVYFLEYGVPPRPVRVLYDRRDSAFARLTEGDVDWEPVRRARLVHLTGITPALGDGPRALVHRAMREASAFSFDVNYRASLWPPADARRFLDAVLPHVRYLFLGQAEAQTIFNLAGTTEQTLEALARLAPKATVSLQLGEAGAIVLDGSRFYRPRRVPTVQVVDPIGAGDAYVAGFLWAVLEKRELQEAVDVGTVVGALKCSMWGDIALVTPRDVAEVLGGGPDVRR